LRRNDFAGTLANLQRFRDECYEGNEPNLEIGVRSAEKNGRLDPHKDARKMRASRLL
jgi:hypothetical protein